MTREERVALLDLLKESIPPLQAAFGPFPGEVRFQRDSEDFLFLVKVVILLPLDYHDPEAALRRFDEAWWIDNCHRSNGHVVFDYELTAPRP